MPSWRSEKGEGPSQWLRECSSGKNLVHRDIKPDNILLTTSDLSTALVKLADFGFCKIIRPDNMDNTQGHRHSLLLSPRDFARIAQLRVAYELLTGVKPYPASTMGELKAMQSQGVPRGQGFPEGYESICQGFIDFCLVYDPNARPNIDDVLRHPFFDQIPHLWSAINIVKEADDLLDKMQRFLHYLRNAGMEENYQSFECASKA
jgi:serine/threonine protein kinase